MGTISTINFNGFEYHHTFDKQPSYNKFAFHCHEMYEIYYFIQGEGSYVIEGNHYKLVPNCLVIIRKGEFHHYKIEKPSEYERCALHFSPEDLLTSLYDTELLSPFLNRELGKTNILIPKPEDGIDEIFQRIDECKSLPKDIQKYKTQFLLGELLSTILLISRRSESTLSFDKSDTLVTNMLHHINLNITNSISLDDLAASFFVSKYYLSHVFKKFTGVSVLEYILRKKVLLASQLIKDGKKANQAAQQCGFGDYSSFFRAYKRIIGTSPTNRVSRKR